MNSKFFILYIYIQNCLQFDSITVILDKRIKSQGGGGREEEHDFIIGTPMKETIMAQHIPHEGIDISKSCFFLDFLMFIAFVQNNCCGIQLKTIFV